ncbi:MAG: ATPase, partial [Mesorhizobium sp.]
IIRSAIADSSASTLSFLSSMGQRQAIAFGEGVATTMRLKFEKLDPTLIPGSVKYVGDVPADPSGGDVDLAAIVGRLRNAPKQQPATTFTEMADTDRQAGDPGYRKPAAPGIQPSDDFDLRYGLKPATFGMRPQNE